MRILIAGSGAQGGCSAGVLAKEKDVEQLICADKDINRAKKLVDRLIYLHPQLKIDAAHVDFSKYEDTLPIARSVDVVLNTSYPDVNVPILKACLESGAHYIDLASFPFKPSGVPEAVTMDALLALDNEAKSKGIVAITNAGCSPGFTDVVVHHIVNQFDMVDRVLVRYIDRLNATDLVFVSGAVINLSVYLASSLLTWDNGKLIEKGLLESCEEYEFPEPVGKGLLFTVTFPELQTITKYLPEVTGKSVKYVEMKGAFEISNWTMKDIWIEALRRLCIKSPYIKDGNIIELLAEEFIQPSDFKEACDKGIVRDEVIAVAVEVTGLKNGKQARQTITGMVTLEEAQKHVPWTNALSYFTSMNGSAVALMVARGQLRKPGVGSMWYIDEPGRYLEEVKRRGVRIVEKLEHPPN